MRSGHGLQWLWPFLLGYAPRKTAILDEVCFVHPHDHMQYLLKLDLQARMQRQTQIQKAKPAARSLRLRVRLSRSTTARQQLTSETPVEALMTAPGRDFLHVDAPGPALARIEAGLLLKQYSYKAELYGVQDRSLETVEVVFQPWYQSLLDMGSIQVWLHLHLMRGSLLFLETLPQMRLSASSRPHPPIHLHAVPSPTHPPTSACSLSHSLTHH